ncbi:MAG: SDR family oxidoreductase [Pseudomonadaceae bacterium]|nr:SDR family oxidoreductase [Pseudomonadaceae bacterium]
MKSFEGKLAVVTGGGYGMGRSLVRQLAREGAAVAACDLSADNLAETLALVEGESAGAKVTSHICDVSNPQAIAEFRREVEEQQATTSVNLLFNNAGIGGGGSFVDGSIDEWEKTFNVCWGGVYHMCRAFLPMLVASDEGHVINTSSVNGFWAAIGRETPHTSYSAAKFAVKGFTEALKTDLEVNAPHVKCSVVMPGHIGTGIARNSAEILGGNSLFDMTEAQVAQARARMERAGMNLSNISDDTIREMAAQRADDFEHSAPTSADEAAQIILRDVKAERWRILVGDDAYQLDALVRSDPEAAYDSEFYDRLESEGVFNTIMREQGEG